jgi:hypothetical protein
MQIGDFYNISRSFKLSSFIDQHQCYKTFAFVTKTGTKKARVFVPCKPKRTTLGTPMAIRQISISIKNG